MIWLRFHELWEFRDFIDGFSFIKSLFMPFEFFAFGILYLELRTLDSSDFCLEW